MKGYKKVLSLLSASAVAATTIIGSGAAVFAAGNTVTLPTGTTYDIYQIFTGTVKGTSLEDAQWGADAANGYTAGDSVKEEVLNALKKANNKSTDVEKMAVIKPYANIDGTPNIEGLNDVTGSVTLDDGYYIFNDVTSADNSNANSYYVVRVVGGNIDGLEQKIAYPTPDKAVSDDNGDEAWSDDADHEIGEEFKFKLTANIPNDNAIEDYKTYFLQFNDTQSKGVSYDGIESVKLYADKYATDAVYTLVENTDYTASQSDQNLTVTIKDLKAIATDTNKGKLSSIKNVRVEVIYKAHLNADAKTTATALNSVGKDGNINYDSVTLTYSNNPTWEGTGTPSTDTSEEDTVWVTSLNLPILKTNSAGDKLDGVEFKLYTAAVGGDALKVVKNSDGNYRLFSEKDDTEADDTTTTLTTDKNGAIVIKGLEGKKYYLEETEKKDGYVDTKGRFAVTLTSTETEDNGGASVTTTIGKSVTAATNADAKIMDDGTVALINKTAAELPSTGGQGTTMILLFGAAAVAGGVALKSRRKLAK